MYIGDKYYGQFILSSFISSRSFHATGHCCLIEKDYYKILGVPKDASQDDIKKVFHSVSIITVQNILRYLWLSYDLFV